MNLKEEYAEKGKEISERLNQFKNLEKSEYKKELLFCLLTPQSNAKKCWSAVEEISKLKEINKTELINILKTRTRFHNNKSRYISEALSNWNNINEKLADNNTPRLRNWLSENINGLGLKEASHFLRNIGKSNNEIAILDRHILRNLKSLNIIEKEKIKSKKDYLNIEAKFIEFSKKVNIPIDCLDLLFWSRENGEIFK